MAGEIAVQSNRLASSSACPHRGIEIRDAQDFGEQLAVHVRKARQILIERHLTALNRRVQHLEEPCQPRTEVGSVVRCALLNELEKDVARLEDPGVVGKQAEHDSDQEQLQVVAFVAGCLERIVQARDQLGRLDVDWILIAERPALHTDDEPELLDLLGQVDKREPGLLAFLPVEQLEHLEIAKQLVAGAVPLGERIEVPASLMARNR